ncbi:MAG: acyl-CoA thioesterase [Rickettsiaceae bacterium]|jgi:acyl-CoA thioesterase-1|nr:acyl-CoA thioesterase [Rickettsiaceae bacterium]
MHFVFRVLLVLLLGISSAWGQESKPLTSELTRDIKIIVLGDGLMSGYGVSKGRDFPATLGRRLLTRKNSNFRIHNRSVDGYTSADGVKQINKIIYEKPDLVILELGSRDVFNRIPLQTTYKNLAAIVTALQEKKIFVLVMATQPPSGISKEYEEKFTGMYNYLSNQHKVPLHPDIMKDVSDKPALMQKDGFHPNQNGIDVMADNAASIAEKMLRYVRKQLQGSK